MVENLKFPRDDPFAGSITLEWQSPEVINFICLVSTNFIKFNNSSSEIETSDFVQTSDSYWRLII